MDERALGKSYVRRGLFRGGVLNVRGIIITGNEKDADFQCGIVCETRELAIYHRGVLPVAARGERKRRGTSEPIGVSLALQG